MNRSATTLSQAFLPELMAKQPIAQGGKEILALLGGVTLLALCAQITIPLAFTPVPITGQTFGVALLSLLWGQKRAMTCMGSYLALGALGAPIFALGQSGLFLGPTTGYLIGMLIASAVMGTMADRGMAKNFKSAYLTAVAGSACIFFFGLLGLAFFIPSSQLLAQGLLPFLPGDLIKSLLAALIASSPAKARGRFFSWPLIALLSFGWAFTQVAMADINVAFFEKLDHQGSVVSLAPGERFYHLALQVPNGWLDSRPYYGVAVRAQLLESAELGRPVLMLVLTDAQASSYQQFIGAPYDSEYQWGGDRFYCSELLALILGIAPRPMDFSMPLWPARYQQKQGQLGISPDEIYQELIKRGAATRSL